MTDEQLLSMVSRGLHLIPEYMRQPVMNYLFHGYRPGSFLYSMLINDSVLGVMSRADDVNKENIDNWVKFLYNYFPSSAWGDKKTVNDWMVYRSLLYK